MLQTAQQHTQFNCQSIYLYLVDWLVSFYFVVVTSNYVIAIDSIGSIRTSLVQSSAVRRQRAIGVLVLVVYLQELSYCRGWPTVREQYDFVYIGLRRIFSNR